MRRFRLKRMMMMMIVNALRNLLIWGKWEMRIIIIITIKWESLSSQFPHPHPHPLFISLV